MTIQMNKESNDAYLDAMAAMFSLIHSLLNQGKSRADAACVVCSVASRALTHVETPLDGPTTDPWLARSDEFRDKITAAIAEDIDAMGWVEDRNRQQGEQGPSTGGKKVKHTRRPFWSN